ncbi:MAG: hypothetical protein JJLCMIEE_03034 [Acidimicrobiales bacterium]|nr:hypothetical protein [Acidimicrobiales bacterium]
MLAAAVDSFGRAGYEATSLDALAGELGVTKQTILYYFPTKEKLLEEVVTSGARELTEALDGAIEGNGTAWERVEAVVRTVFRLAVRRPELLGLLREVSRLGPPAATWLTNELEPQVERAVGFLEGEMAAGRIRSSDARLLLVSAYSTVIGVATEVEVLRAVGIEPTLRSTVQRRRELLSFLRSALMVDEGETRA